MILSVFEHAVGSWLRICLTLSASFLLIRNLFPLGPNSHPSVAWLALVIGVPFVSPTSASQSKCADYLNIYNITEIHQFGIINGFEDLDYDGYLDIVGGGPDSTNPFLNPEMRILRNLGDNVFEEIFVRDESDYAAWWTGDSDQDGLKEFILVADTNIQSFTLWESIDSTRLPLPPQDIFQQDSLGRLVDCYRN